MQMELTFLGTGTSMGVPVICCKCESCMSQDVRDKRLRTSALLKVNDTSIVFDAGPDFRQQMLVNEVERVDAIVLTHSHKDHVAGLDDVRAYNYFMNQPMRIYARDEDLKVIKREFDYVFAEVKYQGIPQMNLIEIENKSFEIDGIHILPVEASHHKIHVFGYRVNDFTYITDANHITEKELEKVKGSKVIVLNALRRKHHFSHFTLEQAVDLLMYLKPERAYLTHISHHMGTHENLLKELPSFIQPAYDGLKIII